MDFEKARRLEDEVTLSRTAYEQATDEETRLVAPIGHPDRVSVRKAVLDARQRYLEALKAYMRFASE